MNAQSLLITLAAASILTGPAAAADTADGSAPHLAHEGPSISIPASDIKFVPTGVKSNGLELTAALAYGNFQTGKHGSFVKMPAGYSSPSHTHTNDYYAVVVQGVAANHAPGARDVPLPVGSYWFQKGEEAHVTKCLSKTDCLFFLVQPGKFDYAPAEQGKK